MNRNRDHKRMNITVLPWEDQLSFNNLKVAERGMDEVTSHASTSWLVRPARNATTAKSGVD